MSKRKKPSIAYLKTKVLCLFILGMSLQCEKEYMIPDYVVDEYVEIETHRLHAKSYGSGHKTIIFENGLGQYMRAWFESGIFEAISKDAETIVYNRAGIGESTVGPDPRDLPTLSGDLNELVDQLADNQKVILAGHSIGGAIIRKFATEYPDKIEGLLFIDATVENFQNISDQDENALVGEINNKDNSRLGTVQEAKQLKEIIHQLSALPPLPDIPVVVLTSVKIDETTTEYLVNKWSQAQQVLGIGISDFTHIETEKSGHFIHLEEPELVINSIRNLMNK